MQMKRRNDRLSKEAIEASKFVWKLQDEESDDEVQAKLNRLKQMSGEPVNPKNPALIK